MSEHEPQPLDYAPQTRRKARRRVVIAVVAVVLIAGLWRWGPAGWDHARLLYYQSRCMRHLDPSDKVVLQSTDSLGLVPSTAPLDAQRFFQYWSPPGRRFGAIVLLHEMKRPDGQQRLVVFECTRAPHGIIDPIPGAFAWQSIEPVGLLQRKRTSTEGISGSFGKVGMKVFAAQPDPTDQSHFTFRVQSDEGETVFDGWLTNEDKIVIEPRK